MKKVLALALTLLMVLALCACTSVQTQQTTETAAPAATPEMSAAPAPSEEPSATPAPSAEPSAETDPIKAQINLIYQNLNTLKADETGRSFWYTVTDLDHNGRLEFTAAITEGEANNTTVKMYEVNSANTALEAVSLGIGAGEYMPEIIEDSVDTYKDASGAYHYIYTDTNSTALGGSGHYISKEAMTLSNGALSHQLLAYQDVTYVNGYTVYATYDQYGKEQDPTSFSTESVLNTLYPNAAKSTTKFDWFNLSEVNSTDRLYTSYCVFAGTTNPAAVQTTATPSPTPTIQVIEVANPIITKNPTGETLTAGDSCTFIAQATGYKSVRWQLVSPYGYVLDAASSNPYPAQMQIWGATTPTLVLSNVPQDMNGWKVQAVFTGDTQTATTSQASISVSAAPAPSYVYITFSAGQGTSFYDTYNYVTVYSSNGADIHVEATKGGDSGCYYSATISSGSSFPVQGIAGQNISVDVIATCGNSQANVTYYVNATPVVTPTPTYEPYTPPVPTDNPGGATKSGYVDSVNTDGGGIYVGVTFDDGSYGRYDISNMVSNPPNVGQGCWVSFASDGITITGFAMNGDPD